MNINSDTSITISVENDYGNYISIRKTGDDLKISSTARKPKGGAKSTLKKIVQILEVIPLDSADMTTLANLSKGIEKGYTQKNAKKNALRRFIYRKHTKRVHQLASRISQLTTQPDLPQDTFSQIGGFLDVKTLAALSCTSKTADTNKGWLVIAKELGWEGTEDVEEAKEFIKNLTGGLKYFNNFTAKNILKMQRPNFNSNELINILNTLNNIYLIQYLSNDEILPLLNFLSKTTESFKEQNITYPLTIYASGLFYGRIKSNPESLVSYAKLFDNLGDDMLSRWIVNDINISSEGAEQILDLCSKNINYADLLSVAASNNHLGWAKALASRQPNNEVNSCPGTKAMLTIFLDAGLTFPKSDLFLGNLLKTAANEEVILEVLDLFKDEERDVKFQMMNNRRDREGLPNSTLYELAKAYGHSSLVLRKLDPKLTHF